MYGGGAQCSNCNYQIAYTQADLIFICFSVFSFRIDKSYGASVKCLLLDETGTLKSDNCSSQHKVICTNGNISHYLIFDENGLHLVKQKNRKRFSQTCVHLLND